MTTMKTNQPVQISGWRFVYNMNNELVCKNVLERFWIIININTGTSLFGRSGDNKQIQKQQSKAKKTENKKST